MFRIRESFAGKLLAGMLATVGLLLAVTWLVVRAETDRQVDEVVERAARSAATQFAQSEATARQQVERVAHPLTGGIRTAAALDAGDMEQLAGQAAYEVDLAGLQDVLLTFSDAQGEPVLSMHGTVALDDVDPAGVGPLARRVAGGGPADISSYRVFRGHLFSIRTLLIERFGRTWGTLSLGLPMRDGDVERIGQRVGVEVCFVVDGACVAGTGVARDRLASLLASRAGSGGTEQVEAFGSSWSVSAEALIPGDPEQGWRVTAVPLDDVLAPFHRITRALVLGGGAALSLALLVSLILSRSLSRPVRALVKATEQVARGDYEGEVSVTTHDELGTLATAFNDMTRGLLLKERYRSVLDKVVSRDVAEELVGGSVELGGETRRVTVLFGDIRGFTALTDGMEPQEVIGLLNECMERLSDAVEQEGGIVDKYVGDEIMAVFGAPVTHGDDARRAVRASLRMRAAMEALNAERAARGDRSLALGVGLNTGQAVAGNMGSTNRLNYTVLGDMVNLAARLCSGAGPGEILATGVTLEEAGGDVTAHRLGARAFKGFATDVEVFAVEGMGTEQPA